MNTNAIETNGFLATPSVARRQLQTSIGAVAVIAMVAVGTAFSVRSNTPPVADQLAVKAAVRPVVVKAAVRVVPSERMQASDQTRSDRRS